MKTTAIALLLALAACREAPRHAAAPPPPPAASSPQPDLLEIVRGGAVVSRTGEALLPASAVRAIDGNADTRWISPPYAHEQTLVFSLAGPARVTGVGFATGSKPSMIPTKKVRVDFSLDNHAFAGGGTFTLAGKVGLQTFPVTPVEASFVRVVTLEGDGAFAVLGEVAVHGTWIREPQVASIEGCWSVNGSPAAFVSNGARDSGAIGGTERTVLDGGTDGRFYRFAWIRGAEYGLSAMSVTNDGAHLSGIVWHEQAIDAEQFLAADWLGDRVPAAGCGAAAPPGEPVFRAYLDRLGYYPLYGLRFSDDGTFDDTASAATLGRVTELLASNSRLPVRFLAHELRQSSPQQNLAVTQKEIAGLRQALERRGVATGHISFVALGQERPRREATSDLTRAMYSGIEIEVAR